MAAYLIVDTLLHDADPYEQYKAKARPLIEKFGGEYLARGGRMKPFEKPISGHPPDWCLSGLPMLKPRIAVSTLSSINKSLPSARNPRIEPR
jgi:Domain of unknown function (DUF1330)